MNSVSKAFLLCLVVIVLAGCGTITPNHVKPKTPAADSSTPIHYIIENDGKDEFNNGFLKFIDHKVLITQNKRADYNNNIESYKLQFKAKTGVTLTPDAGIEPYTDEWGNPLFLINKQYCGYLKELERMRLDETPVDSLWLKLKDKVQ